MTRYKTLAIGVLALSVALAKPPRPQGPCGKDAQGPNKCYGVSGGNVKDSSTATGYCCSGTLGSLVTDGSKQYILSNNHVVGLSGEANKGDPISQPGLIDNRCKPATTVADFTVAAPFPPDSNVDAAIAQLIPGAMDPDGYIMGLGIPSSYPKQAKLNMSVTKSGRTSGVTKGRVTSVNTDVTVRYSTECGGTTYVDRTFSGQIITSNMSRGGDSGSLTVTNDTCHQPVGLLYAGSPSATIHNPIGQVLQQVGAKVGKSLTFVGTSCGAPAAPATGPSQSEVDYVSDLVRRQAPGLMSNPAIIGVGVSDAEDNPSEAVLAIYIDRTHGQRPQLPDRVAGARVKVIFTDPFIALGCCQSCKK